MDCVTLIHFVTSVAFLTFLWDILRLFAILYKIREQANHFFETVILQLLYCYTFSWLTSIVGVMPLSSSLYSALRIRDNLSCKWAGNLNVLEFSTRALETPCQHNYLVTVVWQIWIAKYPCADFWKHNYVVFRN